MDPAKDETVSPSGRARAPTITIDTSASGADGHETNAPEFTTSPTSMSADTKPELHKEGSSEPVHDRPTSPHNISTSLASRGNDRGHQNFLSVPADTRSRQNSVDSEDGSRSFASSQEETVANSATATTSTSSGVKGKGAAGAWAKIKDDPDALKPDVGKEADFEVENNPFAFSPGQLTKMFNPKSLAAFYALGGLAGLEKGLRTNRENGLSLDETHVEGTVSFDEATAKSSKAVDEGVGNESAITSGATHETTGTVHSDDSSFVDRKRVFKDNRIPEKKGKSFLQLVWITYNDKVLILLSVAAVVSLAVGLYQTFGMANSEGVEWVEGVAIIVAIVIVVLVGSLNDWQKERQFAKLNRKKTDRVVKVVRSGKTLEISVFDILSGDVVHLEPGDLIPVDGVLIQGFNVKCDESQATGESDIIRKQGADEVFQAIDSGENLKKADPFIQSGARVMEGVGTFLVTSTGIHSSYGKTLMALDEDPEITPLQSKLNVIAEYIAKLGGAAGLLLFIVLFIQFLVRLPHNYNLSPAEKGQQFLNIFIVVVTIIVVAVPEGLPLAVTLALAFATTRMLRDNNLVRHLKACEVMGNATTICSDKTGTLTQNKMQVVAGTLGTTHRFGDAATSVNDDPSSPSSTKGDLSAKELTGLLSADVRDLLRKSIVLNSTAFEGEVDGVQTFIGSKTESALLIFAREHLGMGPVAEERSNSKTLQLIPFDSGRKCMGIVVQLEDGRARLYVKGASEILLAKCTRIVRDPGKDVSSVTMTDENSATVKRLIEAYASRSLRTIGIVYTEFDSWPPRNAPRLEGSPSEVDFAGIFRDMTFLGMVGIQDPLRDGVPEAVKQCQRAGVVVRMVTGDNKMTAQAIATQCGILWGDGVVMEGPDFRNMSRAQQESIIPRLQVLARSSPEDKRILVRRLKDMGETVAVTGDGTNDAPALKLADVGFSMGIAGTEVAKEASAIILMDDNFNSIVKALKWGRAVNDAVKRFLQFQITVNITAVVTTFVTAVSSESESSILTAVQLLWVNLIMDTLAALALATDPPHDSVLDRKPEPRGSGIISVTMWKMIIGQAIYQLVITFLLYYGAPSILSYDDPQERSRLETLVFNTFVWLQIFNQWNNRRLDNKFNIFEGLTKNWFFIGINLAMAGAQVLIVFVGGKPFNISQESPPQTSAQWAYAIILGFISIPVGLAIRLIPDQFVAKLIPFTNKRKSSDVPGFTVSDEERFNAYPQALGEVRDELAWLKRIKGGRVNNLRWAIKHPRDFIEQTKSKSPSHSRSNSFRAPQTPIMSSEEIPSTAGTPESHRRSKSSRSRSNSALAAPTVMAGIIAGSIAGGWSPVDKEREAPQFPPRSSPLSHREDNMVTEDPAAEEKQSGVPTLSVPQPHGRSRLSQENLDEKPEKSVS